MKINKNHIHFFVIAWLATNSYLFSMDIGSIHLDSLFKDAVFVGIIKPTEGKFIKNFGYWYKAEVVSKIKGDSTQYVEFGTNSLELVREYLIFLSDKREDLNDVEIEVYDDNKNLIDKIPNPDKFITIPNVYYIKFGGFGKMLIEYYAPENIDVVVISNEMVEVSPGITKYQYLIDSANTWEKYYYKKEEVINYLLSFNTK